MARIFAKDMWRQSELWDAQGGLEPYLKATGRAEEPVAHVITCTNEKSWFTLSEVYI